MKNSAQKNPQIKYEVDLSKTNLPVTPPEFGVGTVFQGNGKYPCECTVVDVLRTYNLEGNLIKVEYAATHMFLYQLLINEYSENVVKNGLIKAVPFSEDLKTVKSNRKIKA